MRLRRMEFLALSSLVLGVGPVQAGGVFGTPEVSWCFIFVFFAFVFSLALTPALIPLSIVWRRGKWTRDRHAQDVLRETPSARKRIAYEPAVNGLNFEEQTTGSAARCGVCNTGLTGTVLWCRSCETPHHDDCWDYNRGCARYGCE